MIAPEIAQDGKHPGIEPRSRRKGTGIGKRPFTSRLDEIVSGRPDAKEYVARLEAASEEENIPSGDELADEFQRYFSQQDPGGGPFPGSGSDPFDH